MCGFRILIYGMCLLPCNMPMDGIGGLSLESWWILFFRGNQFHVFLISPNGISESIQSLGLARYGNAGNLTLFTAR